MIHGRAPTSGLTIVEVLVAIAVIGIAFAALASMQISNLRVTRASKESSIAIQVANDVMESVSQDFLGSVGGGVFQCGTAPLLCSGTRTVTVEGVAYTAGYDITVAANEGLATVVVTVDDPKPVSFSQILSCMDVVPPPSFENPAPCPAPAPSGG